LYFDAPPSKDALYLWEVGSMGILDGIMGQIPGGFDAESLAARVGLTPDQVGAALAALGIAQAHPGDTAAQAADSSGLPIEPLRALLEQIGGEEVLAKIGGVGGLAGGLGGLFGR
jgi:fructose-specific phosphotransferase system IIC component